MFNYLPPKEFDGVLGVDVGLAAAAAAADAAALTAARPAKEEAFIPPPGPLVVCPFKGWPGGGGK